MGDTLTVAAQGCVHGECVEVFSSFEHQCHKDNVKPELLLWCGDVETTRTHTDLTFMTCPKKYRKLSNFAEYYSGRKTAPCLTLFVGGNHEVSNVLRDLYFGGWVAPGIFYLGTSGLIEYKGRRIAGISGIHKDYDYRKGYFEKLPFDESSLRSVYHIRLLEILKMKSLGCAGAHVCLSHDWPACAVHAGNTNYLFSRKPDFQPDVEAGMFASKGLSEVLETIQPTFWFAGHHHIDYQGEVYHDVKNAEAKTIFYAMDKGRGRHHTTRVVNVGLVVPSQTEPKRKRKFEYEDEEIDLSDVSESVQKKFKDTGHTSQAETGHTSQAETGHTSQAKTGHTSQAKTGHTSRSSETGQTSGQPEEEMGQGATAEGEMGHTKGESKGVINCEGPRVEGSVLIEKYEREALYWPGDWLLANRRLCMIDKAVGRNVLNSAWSISRDEERRIVELLEQAPSDEETSEIAKAVAKATGDDLTIILAKMKEDVKSLKVKIPDWSRLNPGDVKSQRAYFMSLLGDNVKDPLEELMHMSDEDIIKMERGELAIQTHGSTSSYNRQKRRGGRDGGAPFRNHRADTPTGPPPPPPLENPLLS